MNAEDPKRVISCLRTGPVWLAILILLACAGFSIRTDIHGNGANQTLLFAATGPLAYPIYYGLLVACLGLLAKTLSLKDRWIAVTASEIAIGNRKMPLEELCGVEVRQNWLGLNRLILHSNNGQDLATKTFLLASPLSKVVPELKTLVNARYDQPSLTTFEA